MRYYYSYARISTSEEKHLQKFCRQDNALERYATENDITYTYQFREDKSGKNFTDRTEWQKLEDIAKAKQGVIVFKDICRFTREAETGYAKYMELMDNGVDLIFIDNPTVSTTYIKQMLDIATTQNLVVKTSLESIVKLLLIVELDRAEQERKTTAQRIRDGIRASDKKCGRPAGKLDKMSAALRDDIKALLADRSITYASVMKKHDISRNTLKKYIDIVSKERE